MLSCSYLSDAGMLMSNCVASDRFRAAPGASRSQTQECSEKMGDALVLSSLPARCVHYVVISGPRAV